MREKYIAIGNERYTLSCEDPDKHLFKNLFIVLSCVLCSIFTIYLTNNPYGSYIPITLIAIHEWHKFYSKRTRSYYGLCRLLLFILIISIWIVFILTLIIESITIILGYHYISIKKVQHLLPYALIFTTFVRNDHDMTLNDKRRYIIHLLYDIPALLLVIVFKFLNNPLNSLYSQITACCYLGCLPTAVDVHTLNNIGINYVLNMCAEYNGPYKTYDKYNIKHLHLPTVDLTAPSLYTIERAIKFMNEAYITNKKVFVHCKVGMGRSAAIALCHLVANEKISPENALKLIKEKRPEISSDIIKLKPVKQFLALLPNDNVQ